jgi:predicted transposase/invertase (TIGR01784 family)
METLANAPLGLAILHLIRETESHAPTMARELITRTKAEIADEALRHDLEELIETLILYKLPLLSREEIQKMLQVNDIRETRVFKEALEEGRVEGREEGINFAICRLAAKNMSAEQIAETLEVSAEQVREVIANARKN